MCVAPVCVCGCTKAVSPVHTTTDAAAAAAAADDDDDDDDDDGGGNDNDEATDDDDDEEETKDRVKRAEFFVPGRQSTRGNWRCAPVKLWSMLLLFDGKKNFWLCLCEAPPGEVRFRWPAAIRRRERRALGKSRQ